MNIICKTSAPVAIDSAGADLANHEIRESSDARGRRKLSHLKQLALEFLWNIYDMWRALAICLGQKPHLPASWLARSHCSRFKQFRLCVVRDIRLVFSSPARVFLEAIFHVLCGALVGFASEDSWYVGPLPPGDSRSTCPLLLFETCSLPLKDRRPSCSVGDNLCWSSMLCELSGTQQAKLLAREFEWLEYCSVCFCVDERRHGPNSRGCRLVHARFSVHLRCPRSFPGSFCCLSVGLLECFRNRLLAFNVDSSRESGSFGCAGRTSILHFAFWSRTSSL